MNDLIEEKVEVNIYVKDIIFRIYLFFIMAIFFNIFFIREFGSFLWLLISIMTIFNILSILSSVLPDSKFFNSVPFKLN